MKIDQNKLLAYSAFSLSYLAASQSEAQIIYANVEPDIILDSAYEFSLIDLNNDLVSDIRFDNVSNFVNLFSYTVCRQGISASHFESPYVINTNSIAISTTDIGGEIAKGFLAGEMIDHNEIFGTNDGDQGYYLAFRKYHCESTINLSMCSITKTFGDWYPEALDLFIGLRFTSFEGALYYGWIRCEVLEEGRKLIIKDYAYESYPEKGIIAGQTSYPTSTERINSELISINLKNNYIDIQVPVIPEENEFKLYNLSGDCIFQTIISSTSHHFFVGDLSNGIYIGEIESPTFNFVQKLSSYNP
ncbi:MAG: hypothetical protein ACHQFW_05060 [Chitinophagales bacterium]